MLLKSVSVLLSLLPVALSASVADIIIDSPEHTVLASAASQAGLVEILMGEGPFTLFAPNDGAFFGFDKYLEEDWIHHLTDLLLYHVTPGKLMSSDLELGASLTMANVEDASITSLDPQLMVNNAVVLTPDIQADNGVVHAIDQVLLPPSAMYSVVDIVASSPDFTILAQLLNQTELLDSLSDLNGPYTVFAPTNEAFEALDNETLTSLLSEDGRDDLLELLSYHVASGNYLAVDLDNATATIGMLTGDEITLTFPVNATMMDMNTNMTTGMDDNMMANDGVPTDPATAVQKAMMEEDMHKEHVMINKVAKILTADILVSNGVIHVVDRVLLPGEQDESEDSEDSEEEEEEEEGEEDEGEDEDEDEEEEAMAEDVMDIFS